MNLTAAQVSFAGLTTRQLELIQEALDETWPAGDVDAPVEVLHLQLVVGRSVIAARRGDAARQQAVLDGHPVIPAHQLGAVR